MARKVKESSSGATAGLPAWRSAASGSTAAPSAPPSRPPPLLPSTAASQARNMSQGTAVPSTTACLQGPQGHRQGSDQATGALHAVTSMLPAACGAQPTGCERPNLEQPQAGGPAWAACSSLPARPT